MPWPLVVASTSLIVVQYYLFNALVQTGAPQILAATGATPAEFSWILTGGFLFTIPAILLSAKLGDEFGRRRILSYVYGIGIVGAIISLLSHNIWVIVIGASLMGSALAGNALGTGLIYDAVDEDRRPIAIGWFYGCQGVGTLAGALVAGLLLETLGYKVVFAVPLIALVVGLVWIQKVPESEISDGEDLDTVGMLLVVVAALSLSVALTFGPTWGWTAPWTLALVALSVIGVASWIVWSAKSSHPLIPIRLMKRTNVFVPAVSGLLWAIYTSLFLIVVPLMAAADDDDASRGFGLGTPGVAAVYFLGGVLVLVGSPIGAAIGKRIGFNRTVMICAVPLTGCFAILGLVNSTLSLFVTVYGAVSVLLGMLFASVMNAVAHGVTDSVEHVGTVTAFAILLVTVGQAIGASLLGGMLEGATGPDGAILWSGFSTVYLAAGGFAAATALIILVTGTARH